MTSWRGDVKLKELRLGEAALTVVHSDYDPWDEVEVVKMLGAAYEIYDGSLLPGKVVAEVEPLAFAPFVNTKWDWK